MTELQTNLLETERLRLRCLAMDDLDALFALYRDPENEASRRVAQKIGMALEKEMMLEDTPALVFSMDRPGSSEI